MLRPKRTIQKPKRFRELLPVKSSTPIDEAISQCVDRRTSTVINAAVPPVINIFDETATFPPDSMQPNVTDVDESMSQPVECRRPSTVNETANIPVHSNAIDFMQPKVIDASSHFLRPTRTIQKPKRFLELPPPKPSKTQCVARRTRTVLKVIDPPTTNVNELITSADAVHTINSIGELVEISQRDLETSTLTTFQNKGSAGHTHAIEEDAASLDISLFSTEDDQPYVVDCLEAMSQPVECRRPSTVIETADLPVHSNAIDFMQPKVIDASNHFFRPTRTIQKPKRFLELLPPRPSKSIAVVESKSNPLELGDRQTSTIIKSENKPASNASFGYGEVHATDSIRQPVERILNRGRTSTVIETKVRVVNTGSAVHTHAIDEDDTSLDISLLSIGDDQPNVDSVKAMSQPVERRRLSTLIETADLPVHSNAIDFMQTNMFDASNHFFRPTRTIQKPKRFLELLPPRPSKSIAVVESKSNPLELGDRQTSTIIKSENKTASNASFGYGEVHATDSIRQPVERILNRGRTSTVIETKVRVDNSGSAGHTHAIDEDATSLDISLLSIGDDQHNVNAMSQPVEGRRQFIDAVELISNPLERGDRQTSTIIEPENTPANNAPFGYVEVHAKDSIRQSVDKIPLGRRTSKISTDQNIHTTTTNHEIEQMPLYVPPPRFLCDVSDEENIELLQTGEPTVSNSTKRKRNKKSDKMTWAREITKKKRQHGEAYEGYERAAGSKIKLNVPRSERKMGPKCDSKYCFKAQNRQCNEVLEADRLDIHKQFWQDMNWDQKKIYVIGLVEAGFTNKNNKYFLKVGTERKQVCRSMFLSTLSVKQWMVGNWVTSSVNGIIPAKNLLNSRRAAVRPISAFQMANNEKRDFLFNFFNDLPKMPSHYCRQRTEKQYLEPNFRNLAELYKYYSLVCTDSQREPLSTCFFSNMFSTLKLGLYQPKKDRCDLCVGFEKGNITLEEVTLHVEQKELARKEKRQDKKKARAGLVHVFTMDVQAVQLSPQNKASALYYKQKLKNHDFSMYNLATKDCTCYWWHEGEGDMRASMFTTCIVKHLNRKCNDELPIILWSDGCVYQNRNQILSNALLDYSVKEKKIVQQKFLVKGHTQMEVDTIHALIERRAKGVDINVPFDYIRITEEARNTIPIEAVLLNHKDFIQYDDSDLYRYTSIRPGCKPDEATVTDIRVLTYNPDGTIGYKTNFTDQLQTLPRNPRHPKINYSETKRVYQEAPKISARRFNDLQELKMVLPKNVHGFYDNLPHFSS